MPETQDIERNREIYSTLFDVIKAQGLHDILGTLDKAVYDQLASDVAVQLDTPVEDVSEKLSLISHVVLMKQLKLRNV